MCLNLQQNQPKEEIEEYDCFHGRRLMFISQALYFNSLGSNYGGNSSSFDGLVLPSLAKLRTM
nr:hypothetical protein Iba_chr01cCG0290 [Ipomoea batatas]